MSSKSKALLCRRRRHRRAGISRSIGAPDTGTYGGTQTEAELPTANSPRPGSVLCVKYPQLETLSVTEKLVRVKVVVLIPEYRLGNRDQKSEAAAAAAVPNFSLHSLKWQDKYREEVQRFRTGCANGTADNDANVDFLLISVEGERSRVCPLPAVDKIQRQMVQKGKGSSRKRGGGKLSQASISRRETA